MGMGTKGPRSDILSSDSIDMMRGKMLEINVQTNYRGQNDGRGTNFGKCQKCVWYHK